MSSVGNAATPSLIITNVNSTATNGSNSAHIQNLPPGTTISPVSVKQERHDEAEIQELAAKMLEAQKAAMAKQAAQQQQQIATGRTTQGQQIVPSNPGGQTNILNYLARKPANTNSTQISSAGGSVMNGQVVNSTGIGNNGTSGKSTNGNCSSNSNNTNLTESADKKACDEESQKGHFGWATFGKIYIPYIVRGTEKYCAVRMVEMKLLNKYLSYLHPDIYSSCTCVRSYYISEAEGRLLNEINHKHCDAQFGRELFTQKDLVVRLSDATKFYQFLDICYRKLLTGSKSLSDRCGFIRINKESVVPYTVRNGEQVVPLFYFEGETENLRQKADYLSGWDLAYLKFCCKVQGIRNELFSSESVAVISLTDIKSYFPNGTEFEDYWPNKVVDSNLLIATRNPGNSVHWTRQPTAPPPKPLTSSSNAIKSNSNTSSVPVSQPARKMPYPTGMQNISSAPRHPVAGTIPTPTVSQTGLTAAAVQALANGWPAQSQGGVSSVLTPMQTEQFLRAAAQLLGVQQQQQQHHSQRNYGQASRNQMTNMMAAAAAARQLYGYSNGSAMATAMSTAAAAINCTQSQPPPPLVRSTSQSQSHMLNCASSIPNIQRSNSCDPNLSMNHHHPASSSYHQSHNQRDKSVASSNAAAAAAVTLHQQQQHHHQRQSQQQQRLATEPSLLVNGRNSNSCSQANSLSMPSAAIHLQRQAAAAAAASVYDQPQGRLSVIPDLPVSNVHIPPYKIQKVFVYDNIMVPCINMKAYSDSDQLMTLTDFKDYFFPQVPLDQCKRFIETLNIEMYKGNKRQINTLIEGGKPCSESIPLIKVRDIIKHMPRFRYMMRNHQDQQPPSKRTRIS